MQVTIRYSLQVQGAREAYLYLLELARVSGINVKFIPYPGSAPSQTAAITGEVEIVVTSMAEQAPLIRGGKLRPLAMLHPDSFSIEGVGEIPSAFDQFPALSEHLPLSQAIGFAVNNKAPQEVKDKLAAHENVLDAVGLLV